MAGAGTSTPKPEPSEASPFGDALDALGAAIQAALADPAANSAQPGQLPAAVQTALDAAAALAPPALQARIQAFADRLATGLSAAMAAASGEAPTGPVTKAGRAGRAAESPVAEAILAAVAGAGEGADLSVLRALQDKVDATNAATSAAADTRNAVPSQDAAPDRSAPVAPGADRREGPIQADSTSSRSPGAETLTAAADDAVGGSAAAATANDMPARAELGSMTTPAATPQSAETHAAALVATRGAPELVAQMAAVISRKLEGRVTRFTMELNPAEMGRVDVRLSINSDGRVAAQMAFDNPAAAADMRGKADELRRQLELSGFNVASEDLSFSDRQTGQGFQRQDQSLADPDIARARAFREADRNARLAEDAGRLANRAVLGLDMRV